MENAKNQAALAWLTNAALPLWSEFGVDWANRGFYESLTLDGLLSTADFRRLRVAARQTYVFSVAATMGIRRAEEAVELGIEFLIDTAKLESGGFASRFNLSGRPTDEVLDLYDHSFVLLAFASAAAVLPKDPLRKHAYDLMDFLERNFTHPRGGYYESLPVRLPRRQNPHMHLLEALLAATQSFEDAIFLQRASQLVSLFVERLFNAKIGALPEYFDDDLQPVTECGRFVVEPGHHSEWIWLLDWHRSLARQAGISAPDTEAIAARLQDFVDRWGTDPQSNILYDEVWSDGGIRAASARLWPQTERLKAERRRHNERDGRLADAFAALERYFTASPQGLWHERRFADGSYSDEPAPASSLYHLTCALTDAG